MRGRGPLALALALALSATACGAEAAGGARRGDGVRLTVLAAASLADAFAALADAFEASRPRLRVDLSLGASSTLREQILAGAPADVFAPADASTMARVVEAGEASSPIDVASTTLQIAVPAGNRAGVSGLADFARGDLVLGLCAEAPPCGRLARQALSRAGVTPTVDTHEPDVRSLLTKVEAGELDAGIVYRADVVAAGEAVEAIDIAAEHNVVLRYPMATLERADEPEVAGDFIAFARSAEGQAILARFGFAPP